MIWQLLLQVVLIFLNAVFACAEIAVISMNDAKLEKMASDGDKRASRLKKLTSEPSKFLATIQVAITLSGFIGSAFAADNFSEPLVGIIMKAGLSIPENVIKSICVIIITLILSYFTLVFGELIPKRLAMKKAEPLALGMSGMITFISKLFAPIVWVLNASTNIVLRILGIDPNANEENVTEEEIMMMSDAGAEKGTIDEEDNQIIKNIFAFDDLTVNQVCTHRTEVKFLYLEDDEKEWDRFVSENRHGKFPICDENIDNIVGVLDVRKYYRLENKSRENVMKNAVSEPYFVHEHMKVDSLFDRMKKHGAPHFAIVLDEYGGISGVVTVIDLVEQLVGEFSEKLPDAPVESIEKTGDNEWVASGVVLLTDAAEEMGISLPIDKFETLGGYLLSFTEVFPKDGTRTKIETDVLEADIVQIKYHRIEKCILKVKSKEEQEEDE